MVVGKIIAVHLWNIIYSASYNKHTIMEPKALMNADYLDIIYDNRNKSYGGYELRRNYNRRVKKAAGFMLLGIGAIFSFSFITSRHATIEARPRITPTVMTDIITVVPPLVVPKIVPPTPPPPQHLNTAIFNVPKIVENIEVPDDRQMAHNSDLHNAQPGTTNTDGDPSDIVPNTGSGHGTSVVAVAADNPNVPRVWVEQMPQFNGDMNTYISKHLHYPEVARNENISGQVMIAFVVNEDGSVSNVKILRGIGGGCDEEAARMISSMPNWKPGRQNGIPVKVLFTLPIRFVLN